MTNKRKTLDDYGTELQKMMADAALGPLDASCTICRELEPHWDRFKGAADGKSLSAWLAQTCKDTGMGLAYFRRRYDAVEALGEDVRRWMHHGLAVWLAGQTKDQKQLRRVKEALRKVHRDRDNQPMGEQQGKRIAKPILGKSVNHRADGERVAHQRIKQLEDYITAHGLKVPPWIRAV